MAEQTVCFAFQSMAAMEAQMFEIFEMATQSLKFADAIVKLDFLVVTIVRTPPLRILICIGEQSWSRCVRLKDTTVADEQPVIEILSDEGGRLVDMIYRPSVVESEVPLSDFMAGGYVSIRNRLGADNHRNTRLAFD